MFRNGRLEGAILVVDDHEVFRFGLVQLLKHSFSVDTVYESGRFEDALGELEHADLKLVLIDLDMPGLTDVASDLSVITERRPDVRVVVVSGSGSRSDILSALAAGVHGYILKSQGSEVLVEKLRYVLGGEIYVPPQLAERTHGSVPVTTVSKPPLVSLDLSDRQKDVLQGLIDGLSNKEIAHRIGVSEGTVKMHMAALFRALGATNRTHAVAIGKELIR